MRALRLGAEADERHDRIRRWARPLREGGAREDDRATCRRGRSRRASGSGRERWAEQGMRVLVVAKRELPADDEEDTELTPLGILGIHDAARAGVARSVEEAREAGVRTVMITGDHPGTALAIARETRVVEDDKTSVMTGAELDELSDDELAARSSDVRVYARVVPRHKVRIVDAFRRHGEVVAMTGDGVNDVPALEAADIGVAMGERGHRRGQGGGRPRAHRRRLLDHRRGDPARPVHLRERAALRPLPARGQRRGGDGLCTRDRPRARCSTDRGADPGRQPAHRRPAGRRAGGRSSRARRDAAAAPAADARGSWIRSADGCWSGASPPASRPSPPS